MIQYLFWDNDGVLVDTENLYYRASAETLTEAGVSLSREEFADISLRQGGSVFSLVEHRMSRESLESLRMQRDERYSCLLTTEVRILPGVEETLKSLQGQVGMAVVTGSRREHFEIIHRASGLLQYFDFCMTREDYVQAKPHPESYLSALTRSGRNACECLVIEDSPRGVAAARGAGLRCLIAPGPFFPPASFEGAGYLLADIRETVGVVLPGGNRISMTS